MTALTTIILRTDVIFFPRWSFDVMMDSRMEGDRPHFWDVSFSPLMVADGLANSTQMLL